MGRVENRSQRINGVSGFQTSPNPKSQQFFQPVASKLRLRENPSSLSVFYNAIPSNLAGLVQGLLDKPFPKIFFSIDIIYILNEIPFKYYVGLKRI